MGTKRKTGKPAGIPLDGGRLAYLDYLRVSLVILVVVHHVAVVYGAAAPFYYVEPPYTEPGVFRSLLIFVLANQAFFMGALFLLAGYFTPGTFERKGAAGFLRDKLLHLGVPLVFFIFVLNPISSIGYYLMPSSITGITSNPTWADYPVLIGLGPLWFVGLLLVFNFCYAGWQTLVSRRFFRTPSHRRNPGLVPIVLFVVVLAAINYLVRMVIPLGLSVLGFPSLAYLPQYLSFYFLGILAFRNDWFQSLKVPYGIFGFLAALVASVFLFPLAFSGEPFSIILGPELNNAMGNGHWQSCVYALWDSAYAVGMCLGLLVLFRSLFNKSRLFGTLLSRNSYAVYIIHTPILIYIAYLLRDMELAGLLKFVVVSAITVSVSFAIAHVIRKVPVLSRIL